MCPQLPVGAVAGLQLAGSLRCPTARPASHAALPWSALEWLNYSTKYFFGGGFVSTQKIIVQIPQPLPVRLTKKIKYEFLLLINSHSVHFSSAQ